MDESRNPFDILEVMPSAEPEVVEFAFRALARKYHPDVNTDPDATWRMSELNWAKGELERDLAGWRLRTERERTGGTRQSAKEMSVEEASRCYVHYATAYAAMSHQVACATLVWASLLELRNEQPNIASATAWKAAVRAVVGELRNACRQARGLATPPILDRARKHWLDLVELSEKEASILQQFAENGDVDMYLRATKGHAERDRLLHTRHQDELASWMKHNHVG